MRVEAGTSSGCLFQDLEIGDCFEYGDKAYIKCYPVRDDQREPNCDRILYNALNLKYGRFHTFNEAVPVQACPRAAVVLEMPNASN